MCAPLLKLPSNISTMYKVSLFSTQKSYLDAGYTTQDLQFNLKTLMNPQRLHTWHGVHKETSKA